MLPENAGRFHPKRWTALTWLVVILWAFYAFPLNYPSFVSYTEDPVTGRFSVPHHYRSLAEIPFPIGWPIHYVRPSYLSAPRLGPVTPVGTPPPPPAPSRVSPLAMAADSILIISALVSLVYLSQRLLIRYSVLAFLALMAAYPLYITLGRLVVTFAGDNARSWYAIAVYFSPIPVALAVRYSVFQRLDLGRFCRPWKVSQRRQ